MEKYWTGLHQEWGRDVASAKEEQMILQVQLKKQTRELFDHSPRGRIKLLLLFFKFKYIFPEESKSQ